MQVFVVLAGQKKMPRSKRQKVVALSKATKKGTKIKEKLVNDLRECTDEYKSIYIFHAENMRNNGLKEVRKAWSGSKFFFGKNRVMIHALGKTAAEEHKDSLSKLAQRISGECGLLFTNSSKDEVMK